MDTLNYSQWRGHNVDRADEYTFLSVTINGSWRWSSFQEILM